MADVAQRARTTDELLAAVDHLRASPTDAGTVELIVRRPAVDERELLERAELSTTDGIVGDTWRARGSRHTDDGTAETDRQITIMNARAIALFAGDDRGRWAEAGDQLFIDINLSDTSLPAGTHLRVGTAVVEVTDKPHTGCAKFAERYGMDTARFVNSEVGVELHLRGINARVVESGVVNVGDVARVTSRHATSTAAVRTAGARPGS